MKIVFNATGTIKVKRYEMTCKTYCLEGIKTNIPTTLEKL